MMRQFLILGMLTAVAPLAQSQAPVIRAGDMFNEVGLYYRAYVNHYSSLLNTGSYPVGNLMKSPGPDQFWDFLQGPTERILRFDYLDPTGIPEAADFPLAKIAERKMVEGVGEVEWTFFEQVPGVGRQVYGFHSEQFSPGMPSVPFSQPIIDFPDTISYQTTWQTSFTTVSSFPSLDPELVEDFLLQTTWNSTFTADAWGVVLMPTLGLLDALRINEEQVLSVAADFGDGWQPIQTDSIRSYYWLSPGRGIIAQITSIPGEAGVMPSLNFSSAAAFVRMFDTNKDGTSGSTDPQPVSNLRVTVSNERVLIQWSKAANATSYQVEYNSGGMHSDGWQVLGNTNGDFLFDPEGFGQSVRFYRVVSLP
jgi:hypothetical protein